MKEFLKYFSIQVIMLIAFCCLPFLVHAQTDPGDCPTCPIDGGLSFLVIAGVGYGIKKIRDSRKQKTI